MELNDPWEVEALRSEVERATAALERVDEELAALHAELLALGRHRRSILRERTTILQSLTSLRTAIDHSPERPSPQRNRPLATPVWVQATEEQAIVFAAGRTLRLRLGDID